jgi:tetraacyldisaccharide 4'-kinase
VNLQQAWLHRGAAAWLLLPVAAVFGTLAALRRVFYRLGWLRQERVAVPVIVVGNVVAGGAGKTPVVMAVVRHLQSRGLCAGIVSRGYGRSIGDCREVLETSDPRDVGDEPTLLRQSTGAPVFVARRRIEAARALLARHPQVQVIVSDDGLQHLALGRDVEICVFDDRGIGNGWLLPAGPLREPWPRPCDIVLHTSERLAVAGRTEIPGFTAHRALADHGLRSDGTRVALSTLRGRALTAVAAIAKPEAFFAMLSACGLQLAERIALPDHDDFTGWPSSEMQQKADAGTLLCTEKDAVKLWRTMPGALAVPLVFSPEPAFFQVLDAKLSSADGYQAA